MMKYHSVKCGVSVLWYKEREITTLISKPINATEKRCPVYIQTVAIFLLVSSFAMSSDSDVVYPALVNKDATWNLILLEAIPVSFKATEKISIIKR